MMKSIYKRFVRRALLFMLTIQLSMLGFAATYYVSNTGNDANSGLTIAQPWKTLAKVNAATFVAGDQILFQRGCTFYGTLTVKNSGAAGNPITYGAYGTGDNPIITGFTTISGWTNEGNGIYSKVITSESQTNMVTIDGVQYGMGRFPNSTFLTYESASTNTSITDNQLAGTPNWTGAEAVIYKNPYRIERTVITNHTNTVITYSIYSGANTSSEAPSEYFIQNDLRTLDSYGEWYHDYSGTGKFYMFFGATDPTTTTVKVSTLNSLFKVNTAMTRNTVDNLSFEGSIRGAFVAQYNCHYLTIQNSSFSFIGADGVFIDGQYANINNSTFNHCNRVSVMTVGTYTTIANNTISNNAVIVGQGNYGYNGTSALIVTNDNATVTGNNIQNTATNGIFVHENVDVGLIKNNYIYNTCLLNWDHGSIYCSGLRTALVIEGNIINKSNGSGVYLDATSSNIEVKDNTTIDCGLHGIFIHRSHDIIVTGNTSYNNDTQFLLLNFINENLMYNITASNNIFISKAATQKTLWYQTIYTGYAATLSTYSFSDNIYARPINDNTTIYSVALGIGGNKTLAEWKTFSSTDANSKKSPQSISSEDDLQFEYNATKSTKTVTLSRPMIDVKGTKYATSVTLQPYTSVVLMKDLNAAVAPGAPTSVVATAGNATASVSFAAPANNGGSAITGYTVTSIPAGGTDTNAGSTSLNHSISGLTNGTSYTFTVKATNSAGTSVASTASNSVIPKAATFTFTGPSSGNVNSASTSFTVTPNNVFTGTITFTPTGTASTGLAAKVFTFSNSSAAQTFTITPTVAGSITLIPTNSGTLTNPSNLIYTANAVVPGAPTSVVAAAGNASVSVSFAAPANNGGSAITGYTVTSKPAGGVDANAGSTSLTHTITGLTNGTTYTFTVKATNSVGTSEASALSNSVIPLAPSDNTPPVISSFLMPTSATSLTVPITAFSASDNIGVTGYLLTETPLTPSSGATGWTNTTPLNYTFSSAGLNAVYAWVKDAAGNVSASVMQEVTLTLDTKQGSIPPTHFIPVWNGENGLNHMNIMVVSAMLEDLPISPEDEIAVFSGANCVGSMKLSETIVADDNSTYLTIPASQDDGSGNGFTINDTIVFKIWDNKNQQEMIAKAVVYRNNMSSWLCSGKYVAGATSVVEIVSYTEYSQTIQLKKGYNMISTNVSAQNPLACNVTQSLADAGFLIKLQDETGNSLENWGTFGGWVNNVGSIKDTEGYKIKVSDNCSLQVTGRPIALPLEIPLKSGWNIISFPRTDLVDAMNIIQPLLDQNKLIKVQDESGNSIENWGIFGGWKNGIGYFIPGKAYKVKMTSDAVLTIQENYLKSVLILANAEETEYFSTEVVENGSEHMNINIVGLRDAGISAGDELAAFDGDICVGTIKITEDHIIDGSAALVASYSSDDLASDGFTEGHVIQIAAWNKLTGEESTVKTDVVSGQMSYAKNSSVLLKVNALTTDVKNSLDVVSIDVFPNPSQERVTVRFSSIPDAGSSIDIVDISGRKVASRNVTGMSEVFNLDQQPAGVYLVKSKLGTKETIHKLVMN